MVSGSATAGTASSSQPVVPDTLSLADAPKSSFLPVVSDRIHLQGGRAREMNFDF